MEQQDPQQPLDRLVEIMAKAAERAGLLDEDADDAPEAAPSAVLEPGH